MKFIINAKGDKRVHGMNNRRWISRLAWSVGLVFTIGISMRACSEASWKEEVLLHDGSKIIAERWHRHGGRGEIGQSPIKEQTVTFTVPGSSKSITWEDPYSEVAGHASFHLNALHILNGKPYIVTTAYGCRSFNKWGRPNPPYILFRHDGKVWQRISITEFPAEFNEFNLIIGAPAFEKKLVSQTRTSGFIPAEEVKYLNSSLTQKYYKTISREPIQYEGPEWCPAPAETK